MEHDQFCYEDRAFLTVLKVDPKKSRSGSHLMRPIFQNISFKYVQHKNQNA